MFARHAAGALEVERELHTALLPELGLDPAVVAATDAAPTNLAYTSYLLATAYGGSFPDGVAALLPCYWIYAEVGAALLERGSPDPRYARWIDTYGGAEFALVVADVLALVDEIGAGVTEAQEARMRQQQTRLLLIRTAVFFGAVFLATVFLFIGQRNQTVVLSIIGVLLTLVNAIWVLFIDCHDDFKGQGR